MSAKASSAAQSKLDLYDFFSVLLPGVYFLITLLPLVPNSLPFGTGTVALILLVGGYVAGRALHTTAESFDNSPSNRETFAEAITSSYEADDDYLDDEKRDLLLMLPKGNVAVSGIEFLAKIANDDDGVEILNDDLKDRFYGEIKMDSQLDLPYERTALVENDIEALYVYARSQLYQHGNTRSQSFQAIYAFYRSTFLATEIAIFIYAVYGFGRLFQVWSEVGNYSTIIGGLGIPPAAIFAVLYLVLIGSLAAFYDAKDDYRKYYIEYLMIDYLTIR